jgi:hypothetical protein
MKKETANKLVYLLMGLLVVLLLYIRYLLLVNEEKAVSIKGLKNIAIENTIESNDSLNKKDSIILELQNENEILRRNIK